jgi:transposase
MNYIRKEASGQLTFTQSTDYLRIPSCLYGFCNKDTSVKTSKSGRQVFFFEGTLDASEENTKCSCGARMHINNHSGITLRHLPFGSNLSCVSFPRNQYACPKCGTTKMQFISFKAPGHMITEELYQYARDLLASGVYTNKEVADLTGLGKNTVKDIDKERLQELYTTSDNKLIKPEKPAKFLGIDEFKLHNGYRYATHIIDMETGHILWIAGGKKKQVVYDFIEHVGLEWMDNVEAVACDMNSDFQEAFEEKCPHIQPVFDYFHIVKNFNDKVVNEVRKDEQRRLYEEGNFEAARALKKTRYILMSSRKTLQSKDNDARKERQIQRGSDLFKTDSIIRKEGHEKHYDALIQENQLLFTLDLIKENLTLAYSRKDEAIMAEDIISIMDMCKATDNLHFKWFANLLSTHFEGIIAHATYDISAAKIEGINNKIKTLRRQGYGYPDDEYFFLKLFDMSRRKYERNPKSHKICD